MKTRLAKKIMKQNPENHLSYHETIWYWVRAWCKYSNYGVATSIGKGDHRITKAISLTSKKKRHEQANI